MKRTSSGEYEVLESDVIELDPCMTGFCGALRELICTGEHYVYRETALSSGNRLFSFYSRTEAQPRALFEEEAACVLCRGTRQAYARCS